MEQQGFVELPVRDVHDAATARLPVHHNDPFDRIAAPQAVTQPMWRVTADA